MVKKAARAAVFVPSKGCVFGRQGQYRFYKRLHFWASLMPFHSNKNSNLGNFWSPCPEKSKFEETAAQKRNLLIKSDRARERSLACGLSRRLKSSG